jgi:hypothetical protein
MMAVEKEGEHLDRSRLAIKGKTVNMLTENVAMAENKIMADTNVKSKVSGFDARKKNEGSATKNMEKKGEHGKEMNQEQEEFVNEEPGTRQVKSPKVKADDSWKEDASCGERKQERYNGQCQIM